MYQPNREQPLNNVGTEFSIESTPEPQEAGDTLSGFLAHLEDETKERYSFLQERPELVQMTLDEFITSPPKKLLEMVSEPGQPLSAPCIARLRMLAYFVAHKELKSQTEKPETNTLST